MKVSLPIDLNAPVSIECGTINKLPVIKTSPFYDAWMSCHMEIMMRDESLEIRCGMADSPASYGYFDDILNTEEIPFWDLDPNSIIERLITEINNGYYIVLSVLREDYRSKLFMHSYVLYGFDTNTKEFSSIKPHLTKCIENKVSFAYIQSNFKKTYDYFKTNTDFFVYGREHSFIVTRMSLKNVYNTDAGVHRAIAKLFNEYAGKQCTISEYDDDKKEFYTRKCFRGLGCLLRIEKAFVETRASGSLDILPLYYAKTAVARLREHRIINLSSMKWIYRQLNIQDNEIEKYIDKYEKCRNNFDSIVNLLIKLELDQNDKMKILDKIIVILKDQYTNERQALDKFIDKAYELQRIYYKYENYKNMHEKCNI